MKLSAIILLVLFGLAFAKEVVRYDGYKVYRIIAKSSSETDLLRSFQDDERVDFWSIHRLSNVPIDAMVSPSGQYEFETFLESNMINYEVMIENFEDIVQRDNNKRRSSRELPKGEVTFTEYMRHQEINDYLERLAQEYPSIVKTEVIGRSLEGRNMTLIRISSGGSNKPTIFADAALHAREWLGPPVALYIIQELVENPSNRYLYENVDWAIIPVANPDGYEYTHTTARMWRKTRSVGSICAGTDPNRNFDYRWRESGASVFQCSDIYAGRIPFSEVETRALRDYLLAHKPDVKLYVAIHSFGTWVLYPWGYAFLLPDNADELHAVGDLFRDAVLEAGGDNYTVGNVVEILSAAAGGSDDYAKAVVGADLSYTLELPGGGSGGFNPPPESIFPIVQQTWAGFKAFQQYVENKYVNRLP